MRILEPAFRVYCSPADLERTVAFYEKAQGITCERRVEIRETGVLAAKVGGFLILSATEERLHGPRIVAGGRNATVRHPDGLVVEYFEAAARA